MPTDTEDKFMVSKGKRWGGINEQIQNTICKIGENKDMHRELYSVFCSNL